MKSDEDSDTKQNHSQETIRTTASERNIVKKVSYFFKCLLKMLRPCRKKHKKDT